MRAWLLAARPKTLPAAMAPVIVGSAMAYVHQRFVLLPALAALAVALLLQVGVNLANDYFDYTKGVDTKDRLGPARVTQGGLIAPGRVKLAMTTVFALSLLPGFYLIIIGGWPVGTPSPSLSGWAVSHRPGCFCPLLPCPWPCCKFASSGNHPLGRH